jgi:hypothetical protein
MKSDEVGTTLKHPETINGNVKNLSKRIEKEEKGECHFYLPKLLKTLSPFFVLEFNITMKLPRSQTPQNSIPYLCFALKGCWTKKSRGWGDC